MTDEINISDMETKPDFEPSKNALFDKINQRILSEAYVHWYQRIAYRLWRMSAELGTIIMSLGIIWLYGLSSLLSAQTVDVSNAKNNVGLFFADAVVGAGVDVSDMKLDWYPATNDIVFTGRDITIESDDGTPVQKLKELKSFFPLADVQAGRLIPKHVELDGGVVSWVEDERGRIRAGLGTPDTLGRLGPLWEGRRSTQRRTGNLNIDGVESVKVRGASAYYINASNGVSLVLQGVSLDFNNVDEVLSFDLNGALQQTGFEPAPISLDLKTNKQFRNFDVSFSTEDLDLSIVGPKRGRFRSMRGVNAPMSLSGAVLFDQGVGLQSADIDLELSEGRISDPFLNHTYEIESFHTQASLNPGEETMYINRFDLESDVVEFFAKGTVSELGAINDGNINSSPLFDLGFREIGFDMRPTLENVVKFTSLDISGRLDIDDRTLDVKSLVLDSDTHRITGDLFFDVNSDGKIEKLVSTGTMNGVMVVPELLQVWPVKFADGARRWVERSILSGDINTLSFEADYERIGDGPLVEKTMDLDYSVTGGVVQYISTMTPATDIVGTARISKNALVAKLTEGKIGDLTLLPSEAEIPQLRPKGGDIILTVNVEGEAADMLSLLNQKPFQFADIYGVDPKDVGGQGQLEVKIIRPLLEYFDKNRIVYLVKGGFTNAVAPFQMGDNRVTDGNVSVDINEKGLKVWGDVNFGPWRTNLVWEEIFDNGLTPTQYHLYGDMPHSLLDSYGFGVREYLDGIIGVDIKATGVGLEINTATIRADFKDTEITLADYWVKEKQAPGTVLASLSRNAETLQIDTFTAQAPDLDVIGKMILTPNFALNALELSQVNIGELIAGSLTLQPNEGRDKLLASFEGSRLDISSIVDNSVSSQTSAFDVPILFEGQVSELILDPLYVIQDATFSYSHNGEAITDAALEAVTPDGDVRVLLETQEAKDRRSFLIKLPDASKAAEAFLGLDNLDRGLLSVQGYLPLAGEEGSYSGELVVNDFTLLDAPILAQLLSLGSLTGLFDALSGEGLGFETLIMPFQLKSGVLSVRDARVYGPALGMTGAGDVDLTNKLIDIDGAIAPAYTANSLLGDIPVLGSLMVGKEGEGVFGLNYSVTGPFEATQVAVNPLSALTPGFLRGIFRKERQSLEADQSTKSEESETQKAEDMDVKENKVPLDETAPPNE